MRFVVVALSFSMLVSVHSASAVSSEGSPSIHRQPRGTVQDLPTGEARTLKLMAPANDTKTKLDLAPPVIRNSSQSSALDSVVDLAKGNSPVSPWFPGRGAVGVTVKVSW